MNGITSFSWSFFLISALILAVIWIVTTRTRIGKIIIVQETPWTVSQWSRILLVILITLFILVDPLFHLITFGIFALLYYLFVNKNILETDIRNIGGKNDVLTSTIPFISTKVDKLELICISENHPNLVAEKTALNKCLFSFLQIDDHIYPKVKYIDGAYHVTLNLSSEKYTSSMIDYIRKAGFQVRTKN